MTDKEVPDPDVIAKDIKKLQRRRRKLRRYEMIIELHKLAREREIGGKYEEVEEL